MHHLIKLLIKSLTIIILLTCFSACGQKGPLIVEQPPEQQQEKPTETTK